MREIHHIRISGRVQGVGYRAWVAHEAERRGLDGWVRNRRDGTVEAVLAGPAENVRAMVEACRGGPALARVAEIAAVGTSADPGSGFQVLPTA